MSDARLIERIRDVFLAIFVILLTIAAVVGAFFLNSYRWGGCP